MPNTWNRLVVFNPGEGADDTDFNRLSLWQSILDNDLRFAMLTRTDPDINAPWQESNFTKKLHRFHQQGCVYAGPSNLQLKNKRGLIAQWIAAPDGSEPKLLCYWLDDDEINLTSAAGDPTNPRYDVIAVKLEWEAVTETRDFQDTAGVLSSYTPTTYKRVKMTARIVQGTPAASPTIPALAAGEAYYAVYKIPATFNALISLDPSGSNEFRDFTFPIGEIKTRFLQGSELMHVPADWTVAADGTMTSTATGKIAKGGAMLSSGEAKILQATIAAGATLGFDYGIHGSTAETVYGTIAGVNTKNFADFSAIDQHTCKPWFRKGAFTSNPRVPMIKVTTTAAQQLGLLELHYK